MAELTKSTESIEVTEGIKVCRWADVSSSDDDGNDDDDVSLTQGSTGPEPAAELSKEAMVALLFNETAGIHREENNSPKPSASTSSESKLTVGRKFSQQLEPTRNSYVIIRMLQYLN